MEIELPNGEIAEFPDNMPHEQMESIIAKQFPKITATQEAKDLAFQQIKKQFPKMPDFLIKGLMPLATVQAESKLNNLKEDDGATGAFFRSAFRAPIEAGVNFGRFVGLPTPEGNEMPSFISESESDKQHPFAQFAGSMAGFAPVGGVAFKGMRYLPKWGRYANSGGGFLKKLMTNVPEGALIGAAFSPEGQRTEGALMGGGLGGIGASIPTVAKGFKNLKERVSSLKNLGKLREEGKITNEQYEIAKAQEQAEKDLAKSKGYGEDAERLSAELPEIKEQENALQQQIKEVPYLNTENMLGRPEGENIVPTAENHLRTAQQNAAQAEENLASHLYRGYEKGVPIAEAVVNHIEGTPIKGTNKKTGGVKQEIGSMFDKVEQKAREQNIDVPNTEEIRNLEQQIRDMYEKSRSFFKNDEEFEAAVKKETKQNIGKTKKTVNAGDLISNMRTYQFLANKFRAKAYSREIASNKDLQAESLQRADKAGENADRLHQLLNENKATSPILEDLNKAKTRWKNEVVPLYKNKVYRTFLNEGYAPKGDLIEALRGNKPGQIIIKDIIKNNPVLTRSILGMRYSHKPGDIHIFDQLANEFIEALPSDSRNLINQHRQSLLGVESAEQGLNEARIKAEEVKNSAERTKKGHEEDVKKQKERKQNIQKANDLNKKIIDIERTIPALRARAKATGQSLNKKVEHEQILKKAEEDVRLLKKQLIRLGIGGSALLLGKSGLNWIQAS